MTHLKYFLTRKIFSVPALIISLFFCTSLTAQDISGSWTGSLALPGMELPLVFHLDKTESGWTASMDSPDQHATGIPASSVSFDPPVLRIEIQNGLIEFEGELVEDNLIEGTFSQRGMSFPLHLKKGIPDTKTILRPQTPKPPFPYRSEEVKFTNPEAENIILAGTLTLPPIPSPHPAVILITGSGPQDRDETLFDHKPFLVIADELSRNGIAILRFDDRGTAESEGDFAGATTADFATDVEAAVRYLRGREDIDADHIGLIGHSEGGIIASMVAAADPEIAFIVLLAGPGHPGTEILLMQNEALGKAAGIPEDERKRISTINQEIYTMAAKHETDPETRQVLIQKLAGALPDELPEESRQKQAEAQVGELLSPWMQYFLRNDPTDYLKKVQCPVLALNGEKDLQVPAGRNLAAIEQALKEGDNDRITLRSYPGLNHLFQEAESGLPSEYGKIEMTFSPEVLKDMRMWIKEQILPDTDSK